MSEVTGTEEIIKNIESKLGKARTSRMVNKALKVTGDEIVKVTKNAVAYYKDSGATYDEVVKSNVKGASYGIKEIDVGWRGDKSRWRLVHLNEFGYTKAAGTFALEVWERCRGSLTNQKQLQGIKHVRYWRN